MTANAQLFLAVLTWALVTAGPVSGADSSAKPTTGGRKEPGREFFGDPKVRVFQIEISEAGLKSLEGAPRTDVSGTVREESRVLTNVAIHLKGNGSFRAVDEKASFAVKFDEFASGQEFFGLTKLMFNNAVQDPSRTSIRDSSRTMARRPARPICMTCWRPA